MNRVDSRLLSALDLLPGFFWDRNLNMINHDQLLPMHLQDLSASKHPGATKVGPICLVTSQHCQQFRRSAVLVPILDVTFG